MTLPIDYLATSIQRELASLTIRLDRSDRYLSLIPQEDSPVNPSDGWISLSDGSGGGFDSVSGAGLYRYLSSVWVFIG